MQEVLLLKCGELVLKGLNRYRFEDKLIRTIRGRMKKLGEFEVWSMQSTVYVEPLGDQDMEAAFDAVTKIFGINSVSRAVFCQKDIEIIKQTAGEYLGGRLKAAKTFRVMAKRADKRFPFTSPEIGAEVGGYLSDLYPELKVRMDEPDVIVTVEIRDKGAYISCEKHRGAGGMPVGSNGRAMLLLSGGIDSPVAGYMMAKRGLELGAVHFFSYPYTSEEAKDKVLKLADIISNYSGRVTVTLVPFTEIQLEISQNCMEDYFTIIMRRMMMRIAQRVAENQDCGALITGESLGQVASQTMEAINCTQAVCTMPVFRPAIGLDKEEIIERARHIGTFETSSLPFEDCCTVFTPRHPQTKPRLQKVEEQEAKIDVDGLVERAVAGVQRVTLG
ncbi:MAG: tRNA uracil 4-sulfurtransferase ThiI [Clostridiaceae bacterium]|nr:tRNA uracil 4-sulfurtransferase ThiI [Clostridiaceae bacterium]